MRTSTIAGCALALSAIIGHAWAAEICARAPDLTALQAAAVQQRLMVAAFSCNEVDRYNNFVTLYRKDLQDSDNRLQAFFLRLNEQTGVRDYHAYKTRLANVYSLRSGGNKSAFCAQARAAFDAALTPETKNLTIFVLAQPIPADQSIAACGETVQGATTVMQALPPVRANPLVTAQSGQAAAVITASAPKQNTGPPVAAARVAPAETNMIARQATSNLHESVPPAISARRDETRYSNRYGERDPYYRDPYSRPNYRRLSGNSSEERVK